MKLQSLAYVIITSRSILSSAKSIRGSVPNNGNIESKDDNNHINNNVERDLQDKEDDLSTVTDVAYRMFPHGVDPEFRHLEDLEDNSQVVKDKDSRIVGGQSANNGEFDYSVSMQDNQGHFCGGSLISPTMVLTAAHCLGGSYDCVVGRTTNINGNGGQSIPMKKEIRHPKYNSQKTDNDFAILVLSKAVDMSDNNVGLVNLNKSSNYPSVKSSVTVVGWGETKAQTRGLSNNLLKVEVSVISNQECGQSSGSVGGYSDNYFNQITDNMMCANVSGGGKDACQGDSGGPCVVKTNGQHTQVGVVSWGIGCATKAFPGVYSRVSEAFDWIEEEVCDPKNNGGSSIPNTFSCGNDGGNNGGNNGGGNNQSPSPPPPAPQPAPQPTPSNNPGPGSNEKWRTVFSDDMTKSKQNGGRFTDGGQDARFYSEAKGDKGVVRLQNGRTNAKKASVYTDRIAVSNYSTCRVLVDFMLIGMKNNDEWCAEYSDKGTENSFKTAKCFSPNDDYNVKRWWRNEEASFSVKNMEEVTLRLRCKSSSRKRDVLISSTKLECN